MDVAVTGAAGAVGQQLVEALREHPAVDRILALDSARLRVPAGVAAGVVDVRDPSIEELLAGFDVLVHLAIGDDPLASDRAMHDRNVLGTRTAVDAAARAGATDVVVVTSSAVYGASADNDVPLSESSPRRAPVDAPGARHVAEVEEWLWERATTLPAGVSLTVLRPAPLVGPGVDGPVQALVGLPRIPVVGGNRPPVQLLHVDDLVTALVLAVTTPTSGAYNVASPGWVSVAEAAAVLGRRLLPLPEEVARALADASWRTGTTGARSSRLAYLVHPWVVSVRRLEAAGGAPVHSNRDALAVLAEQEGAYLRLGGARLRRRTAALAALVGVGTWTSLVVAATRRLRR